MTGKFRLVYFGSFSLLSPDGGNLTPRSNKAKGLLALLGDATDMRRGRRWLESQLWSDRAPAQASGSLRQALIEIRTALGEHADLLGSNRLEVWLEAGRIETDLEPGTAFRQAHREPLESLDVRDEAFEDWMRAFRARFETEAEPRPPVAAPTPLPKSSYSIRAVMTDCGTSAERITGHIIADQVARNLEEQLTTRRFANLGRDPKQALPDLEIRCEVADDGARGVVFLRIEHARDGRVLFSQHRTLTGSATEAISQGVIVGLAHSAALRILHRVPAVGDLSRPEIAAAGFGSLGLRNLARFDPAGLDEAQGMFAHAYERDANGIYLAWRAFARMAQLVEGGGGDARPCLEEVQKLGGDALQQSADNGFAVSLVALTRIMLEDDLSAPAALAERAILLNSNNLFARQTLAVAHSAVGDTETAYQLSLSCRQSETDDDLGHLWDLYHALVCISSGRLDEARVAATRASRAAPRFVAPRRQLVALCAHAGDMAAARSHLAELQRLEQDFSLDRYLQDPAYPVLTLRRAGLIDTLPRGDFGD